MTWRPLGSRRAYGRLEAGWLLAYQHGVYRVVSCDDVHTANWTDSDRELWTATGRPDPWKQAPFTLMVEYVAGCRAEQLRAGRMAWRIPGGSFVTWDVYPDSGRWPMCSCCEQPMPCQAELVDQAAAAAMKRFERDAAKMPGHCWSCGEPVTHRQEAVSYAGMNLDMPGGPVVVFHTRRLCWGAALRYEERWLEADVGRERILTWPHCGGFLIVHEDGSSECTGGMAERQEDCEGHSTHNHRAMRGCYNATAGCPRGCGTKHGCTPKDRVPRLQRRIGSL